MERAAAHIPHAAFGDGIHSEDLIGIEGEGAAIDDAVACIGVSIFQPCAHGKMKPALVHQLGTGEELDELLAAQDAFRAFVHERGVADIEPVVQRPEFGGGVDLDAAALRSTGIHRAHVVELTADAQVPLHGQRSADRSRLQPRCAPEREIRDHHRRTDRREVSIDEAGMEVLRPGIVRDCIRAGVVVPV